MTKKAVTQDEAVREHYEALPYPARDPADETRRLITGSPSHLLEIVHYLRAGRFDPEQPFRALIAGGGTGDGAIMLAQQLADRKAARAEIVYLDLSEASRTLAEARAKARGLALSFVTGSLLDLDRLGLGTFDYIDCCGVLHHLAEPEAGLAALARALAPDGGMGLMVYGALGRIGVYHVQELLKAIAPVGTMNSRIETARRLLRQLPPTNWFNRNPAVGDHLTGGSAGLFDLLLHARDRAYRIGELRALVEGTGLVVAGLIEPWRYRPASYLTDPKLVERFARLDTWDQAAMAELIAGNLKRHIVYATPAAHAGASVAPLTGAMFPVFRDASGAALAKGLRPGVGVSVTSDGVKATFPLPGRAGAIVGAIDGQTSIEGIFARLGARERTLERDRFDADFARTFAVFNGLNHLFLSAGPWPEPSAR
jgi:SAM-dependent methyltransferase